jgi:hypothetical protein
MHDYEQTGSRVVNPSNDNKSPSDDKTLRGRFMLGFWVLFLIILPLVSVILIGITLFGSSSTAFEEKGLAADVLLMITYIVIVYSIIAIFFSDDDRGSLQKASANHEHSNIAITFLFILGVGDSLFNMTRFGDQLILIINQNYTPNSHCLINIVVSATENLFKSFCQLCILMFILYQVNPSIKPKFPVSKNFLMCLATFCLILWLQTLLQEVHHHKKKLDSCILPASQGVKSFDKITPYLYPLSLEFRFASFIELLMMPESFWNDKKNFLFKFCNWLKKKIPCTSCIHNRKKQTIDNWLKKVLSFISGCFKKTQCSLGRCDELLGSILLPASGIFLVILSIVIVLFQEFNMNDSDHRVTAINDNNSNAITLISEICEVALAVIISTHSFYSLYKLCDEKTESVEALTGETVKIKFKIDFSFLLVANLCLYTYCCLTFAGSVQSKPEDKLTQYIRSLTLTASVIPIIQTTLQLIVIWKARQYKRRLTKGTNKMWIILSFAIWLFDTFSAKGYNTNQIQIGVYHKHWDVIAALFIPMAIFFRFHSCIIFANIKDGMYWDKQEHSSA